MQRTPRFRPVWITVLCIAGCAQAPAVNQGFPGFAAQPDGYVTADGKPPLDTGEATTILAYVGDEAILAGDVLPTARQMLEPHREQLADDQWARQRDILVWQLVKREIDTKLLYLDFVRAIPSDKQEQVFANIDKQVKKQFHELQLPEAMAKAKVNSAAELDQYLRRFGSSLSRLQSDFRTQMIARAAVGQNVNRDQEVSHEEMLKYYRDHTVDYEYPARARWEKLTALYENFPDRPSAERHIFALGNQVLRGAPLAAVAERGSQGLNADEGGYHDWTTKSSLVSTELDAAIFSLPIGKLSPVIADQRGLHIVRVIERRDAGRVPFSEAQDEIKKKIKDTKFKAEFDAYLERLRKQTHIWSAQPLPATPSS